MKKVQPNDVVRTTVAVPSHFGDRLIPAGTSALVLELEPDGGYLVEVTVEPASETDDGDFDQATLQDHQFEVVSAAHCRGSC